MFATVAGVCSFGRVSRRGPTYGCVRRRAVGWSTIAAAVLTAASGVALPAPEAHAQFPGTNGRIAYFLVPPNGEHDVWSSNPDGSEPMAINFDRSTLNEPHIVAQLHGVTAPSWAPDGRHLAVGLGYSCAYGPTCSAEIGYVDTATGVGRQLTCDGVVASAFVPYECKSSQYGASISPDGSQVAFGSDLQLDFESNIIVRPGSLLVAPVTRTCRAAPDAPTGCDLPATLLTDDPNATFSAPAAWSPDGNWLVTVRSQFTPTISEDLVAVRTDGSLEFVYLLQGVPGVFGNPDWSPDGSTLMVTGGTPLSLLTFGVACDVITCVRTSDPEPFFTGNLLRGTFSPDGTRAVVDFPFGFDGTSGNEVWTIGLDGQDPQQVTSYTGLGNAHTAGSAWQPIPRVVEPPIATNQSVTTTEDTPGAIALQVSDTSGEALAFAVGSPAHGTLSGTAPNLTYTPNLNFNGSDSFTWSASNSGGSSSLATVSITVSTVNDPPTATDLQVTYDEGDRPIITLQASDPEGDALTFRLVDLPTGGQAKLNGNTVTYKPKRKSTADSFTYQASDGAQFSALATVTITENPTTVSGINS